MAYLKRVTIGRWTYIYIVQSVRRGDRVTKKVLEYLGRDPEPRRLKKALEYWGVKPKGAKRKRGA